MLPANRQTALQPEDRTRPVIITASVRTCVLTAVEEACTSVSKELCSMSDVSSF